MIILFGTCICALGLLLCLVAWELTVISKSIELVNLRLDTASSADMLQIDMLRETIERARPND